jgi:hypothetical protein
MNDEERLEEEFKKVGKRNSDLFGSTTKLA